MFKRLLLLMLLCSGVAYSQTHSVQLTWTQSTSAGVTGNKVYRSATTGGPYILLLTSATPITTYTDGNLPALTTYYYVVTATCSACNPQESAYSNEIRAVTPGDKPTAPSSLSATVN